MVSHGGGGPVIRRGFPAGNIQQGGQAQGNLFQSRSLWYPALYEARYANFGATTTILPMGDSYHGAPSATTFTTQRASATGVNAVFTWSEAPNAFDTPLNLASTGSYQGIIPIVTFNGTDEEADSPDADFWTTAATNAFSFVCWVNLTDTAGSRTFLAKFDETSGSEAREFVCLVNLNDNASFEVWDETANAVLNRSENAVFPHGVWAHMAYVYDGGTSDTSLKIYRNGAQVDDTSGGSGVFVTMQNTATLPQLGFQINGAGTKARFMNGKMAGGPLGPCMVKAELTADQLVRDYNIGRRALAL